MITVIKQKGVTLLEAILTAVTISVLLLALTPYIRSIHRTWQYGDRKTEMLQQGRVAMDKMAKTIRRSEVVTDINNAGTGDYVRVLAAGGGAPLHYCFFYNIPTSPYYVAPSGNIGNNDLVMRISGGIGPPQNCLLAKSLTSLTFTYLKETMDPADPATLEADVRGVIIEMTLSDPTGEFPNPLYISTTVHCRFGG